MTPSPYYTDEQITLHHGDSLDVLREIPDASVDAIVTDPPYGLAALSTTTVLQAIAAWMNGDRDHVPDGAGFMGRDWDRFVPPPGVWDQCWRVLKPGGHLLAFAAPRTADLMGLSIRIAGFEIRDSIHWTHGNGFPKGIDVAKAVDRAGGASPTEQAAILKTARERAGMSVQQLADAVGCTVNSVRDWEDGRARATGRQVEHVVPSPQYRQRLADLLGYSADERRIVGAADRANKDGGVFRLGYSGVAYAAASTEAAAAWEGWNTALRPSHEPVVVARKALAGTVASNVLEYGTGALHVDACRTAAGQDYRDKCASVVGIDSPRNGDTLGEWGGVRVDSASDLGRWPANSVFAHSPDCGDACTSQCPVAELDRQGGQSVSRVGKPRSAAAGSGWGMTATGAEYDDAGGVSRYFPVFRYEPKAPSSERPRLADGTVHVSVKPLELMRWLVRLVTPPNGTVLDPFAGSGTTLEAAILEGFRAIGVEREREYADLCVARLSKPLQPSLFGLGDAA